MLFKAGEEKFGTDEQTFITILGNRSAEHLRKGLSVCLRDRKSLWDCFAVSPNSQTHCEPVCFSVWHLHEVVWIWDGGDHQEGNIWKPERSASGRGYESTQLHPADGFWLMIHFELFIVLFSFKVKCARSVPVYFAETLYHAMKVRRQRFQKWPGSMFSALFSHCGNAIFTCSHGEQLLVSSNHLFVVKTWLNVANYYSY